MILIYAKSSNHTGIKDFIWCFIWGGPTFGDFVCKKEYKLVYMLILPYILHRKYKGTDDLQFAMTVHSGIWNVKIHISNIEPVTLFGLNEKKNESTFEVDAFFVKYIYCKWSAGFYMFFPVEFLPQINDDYIILINSINYLKIPLTLLICSTLKWLLIILFYEISVFQEIDFMHQWSLI